MTKVFRAALVAALLALGPSGAVHADARYLAARDAARAGDLARLQQLALEPGDSVLNAYIDYWALSIRLARKEDVDADYVVFVAREEGRLLAERARRDWITASGRTQRWAVILAEAPMLRQPDQESNCWFWQARMAMGDASARDEAAALWNTSSDIGEACKPVIASLANGRPVGDFWSRARRLLEQRRFDAVRGTLANLPPGQGVAAKSLDEALNTPSRFLARQPLGEERSQRELTMLALVRLAQSDYPTAAARVESLGNRLRSDERAYISAVLGWQAARSNQPEALSWYRAAGNIAMSDELRAWQARAALRMQDWKALRSTIEAMGAEQRAQAEWLYWYGRALAAGGQKEQARALYERVVGDASFYAMLAGDELGRRFAVPAGARPPDDAEMTRVSRDIGVQRALALFREDARLDAVREWNWAMREADDRFLLAAAETARREQLYDRAIYSAERTRKEHDYALRYLVPFYDKVAPAAKLQQLDVYWVYGLMRQESRFVGVARSSVGAQGLMQVMPATAAYVAKKTGMAYHPSRITDMDTNVALGTAYLRMMLDRLDEHEAMAAAGYNAGPGRVPRWKAPGVTEGAIFAETIPLSETRDYVKKVMANTVAYTALLTGEPQSLKARMGQVAPDGPQSPEALQALSSMPAGDGPAPSE
ncbi:transglycosylase SLT domain-containing protein [Niveibacterium sp. SC-1]|uniref:lytic transglycosylase domain-containing protein n=1 Tax=Niveibacterium sp. SC-1 TaxID=3135646 RepID=UPI00311E81F9